MLDLFSAFAAGFSFAFMLVAIRERQPVLVAMNAAFVAGNLAFALT